MSAAPVKRMLEDLWYLRGRLPVLRAPIPWRLPYGGWWLAHPDAMGARVFGYRLMGHPYEEGQWRFVRRVIRPGMTVLDVGANQGFYTILASRLAGDSGRVVAFEPAATEVRKLAANLRLNRCRNVTVEARAVGAETTVRDFHLALGHQGSWSSLHVPAGDVTSDVRVVRVEVVTLDSYAEAARLERVDMIKIDVEGGELDVLRGGTSVLRRFRPLVLCEIEDRRTRQWGYEAREILDFLTRHGYRWHALDAAGVAARVTEGPLDWTMAVAIPEELSEPLVARGAVTAGATGGR